MSKEWKQSSWFDDPEQEAAKCFFDVGNPKVLDDGVVRFDLTIYTDAGDLVLKGFRYDPSEEKLMPPLYRAGQGWQKQVRLEGPIEEMVLEMAQELTETEPVEGERERSTKPVRFEETSSLVGNRLTDT